MICLHSPYPPARSPWFRRRLTWVYVDFENMFHLGAQYADCIPSTIIDMAAALKIFAWLKYRRLCPTHASLYLRRREWHTPAWHARCVDVAQRQGVCLRWSIYEAEDLLGHDLLQATRTCPDEDRPDEILVFTADGHILPYLVQLDPYYQQRLHIVVRDSQLVSFLLRNLTDHISPITNLLTVANSSHSFAA